MIDASRAARRIESDLRRVGTRERAEGEKRYLKSDLTFLGARLPEIRAAARAVAKKGDLDRDGLVDMTTELWSKPVFERRMAAAILLEHHGELLGPPDLPVVEALLRDSKTWALVDPLAVKVVGGIVLRHRVKQRLDKWARDPDFWIRRSSLLAELRPLKQGAAFAPFAARADRMLEEKEFFVRKAIGWVLRETSKRRPDEVYGWLEPRAHKASGVTMREAVKYLGERRVARLMRAHEENRGLP